MNVGERFTTPEEIKRNFRRTGTIPERGGPIIYCENGKAYYDDSEAHTMIIGRTGTGKSSCVSKSYVINCLNAKEDLVIFDPKGELYESTLFAAKNHDIYCLDYRNPRKSTDCFNPLLAPYQNFKSDIPELNDLADIQIDTMARNCIYPFTVNTDPFWASAAADYFMGLVYALFELGKENEINIASVFNMMNMSDTFYMGTPLVKRIYNMLSDKSYAKQFLATYVSAPNDTRASIHSVAVSGLAVFCKSRGLSEMLSNDTISINNIHTRENPKAIYIIVPDESNSYSSIVSTFISQIMQNYIYQAHTIYGGKLPNRLNLIFEEFATIGKCLPNMDNLAVAARSRNIRIMMVLQNGTAQLEDIYGRSKAATIMSSIGIVFTFSANSWEALEEVSRFCGEKRISTSGSFMTMPLISPANIAAMPIGTVLITINNRYKYVTRLPFYSDLFKPDDSLCKLGNKTVERSPTCIFDINDYVRTETNKGLYDESSIYKGTDDNDWLRRHSQDDESEEPKVSEEAEDPERAKIIESLRYKLPDWSFDMIRESNSVTDIIAEIDKKIEEIEELEDRCDVEGVTDCEENTPGGAQLIETDDTKFELLINKLDPGCDEIAAERLSNITGIDAKKFKLRYEVEPCCLYFVNREEAYDVASNLRSIGADVLIIEQE